MHRRIPTTGVVTVAVVDADELVVRGLLSMLAPERSVRLVKLSSPLGADVALLDTSTPGAERRLAELCADPRIRRVAVYTWNFRPWLADRFIGHCASAYLAKSLSSGDLVRALHAIHAGRTVVAPLGQGSRVTAAWPDRGHGITTREAELLSHIAAGLSNEEVAQQMSISINSVKGHVRSAYRKIGVERRSQAVLWAAARGLTAPSSEDGPLHWGCPRHSAPAVPHQDSAAATG
jgi:NarL family two-component system response regulator LiaR